MIAWLLAGALIAVPSYLAIDSLGMEIFILGFSVPAKCILLLGYIALSATGYRLGFHRGLKARPYRF